MFDPSGRARVTTADIVEALGHIGLGPGDLVQVHSSLSALGYVEGGAEAVVDALLEVVGPSGTVMVPTFNHGTVDLYDPQTTASINGAVTEALRKRPGAKRSLHPTHPYAALGPLAEELTCEHLELTTFDPRSPLGKLAEAGGRVLLLGVGMDRNTAAHIGETLANAPCMGYREAPYQLRLPDGSLTTAWSVIWRDGPCLIEWEPLESQMRARGMIRDGHVGDGAIMLMMARDVIAVTYELAQQLCSGCTTRPQRA